MEDPRLQTYLWNGSKFNDRNVPRDAASPNLTTTRKTSEWQSAAEYDMYATTNKVSAVPPPPPPSSLAASALSSLYACIHKGQCRFGCHARCDLSIGGL